MDFMKISRLFIAFAFVALASFAVACGGGESPCESAGNALCEAACACGGADGCIFADSGGSLTFDSEADCKDLFVGLGCMGDDGSLDNQFDDCTAAVDGAQCVDPGDGTSGLESPAECNF
jgi:hypothetical protein